MILDARTALIPIDVQRAFDHAPWPRRNNPAMERNGLRLLAAWRAAGWPLIHVCHDSVQPGSTLAPGLPGNAFRAGFEPRPGEALVRKSVNAAFIGTDLDLRLRRLGVEHVVLFGISTDMCVSTTARVAANLGYRVTVVGDACCCFDLDDGAGGVIPADEVHRAHLATLRAEFGQVADTDEVLAWLARAAA
ncbi:cysteine hydrolase family protein [Vulcaniibacterium tengchongense]|uniref:Nicotinamidase-related amidase n=1 Tax=Vulcaniibacterium tengchongense TaxID=1273429 RepID=A0A3N4W1L9_9GAMM|nr:cysteine hydrolase family protein [Vulcaniibacterium tengchongense]RPE79940.1 nicotinamidase-related amidase [Vulcaniibacterium tengchongense]